MVRKKKKSRGLTSLSPALKSSLYIWGKNMSLNNPITCRNMFQSLKWQKAGFSMISGIYLIKTKISRTWQKKKVKYRLWPDNLHLGVLKPCLYRARDLESDCLLLKFGSFIKILIWSLGNVETKVLCLTDVGNSEGLFSATWYNQLESLLLMLIWPLPQ